MRRLRQRDEGSTQIIMLMAMVCAVGLTLMAIQVAHANDMRTRAQTAADSAAIAAVTPLRDRAIELAQMAVNPVGIGLWEVAPSINADDPVYNRAAREYAKRNGTELAGKVHPSGRLGHTMKVTLRTEDCQLKPERELTEKDREDLRNGRNLCTDTSGNTGIPRGRGTATAIAELRLPACSFSYIPDPGGVGQIPNEMNCGGTTVWSRRGGGAPRSEIIRVFKIRLVAAEDPVPYTGVPTGDFPVYTGPIPKIPENACPLVKQILTNARRKIGWPYVWGGESRQEGGFDCSGLIYASYLEAGLRIPRTTFGQWPYGVHIPRGSEKAGDLVFFNSGPGTSSNSPGHVGLVVDPEQDLMIEARCTACGPIKVASYRRSSMLGFTRPLLRMGGDCN